MEHIWISGSCEHWRARGFIDRLAPGETGTIYHGINETLVRRATDGRIDVEGDALPPELAAYVAEANLGVTRLKPFRASRSALAD